MSDLDIDAMPAAGKLKGFTVTAGETAGDAKKPLPEGYGAHLESCYGRLLPTTAAGWDWVAMLANLSQYDPIAATDSDDSRCVQAVSLAMRILQGPAATAAFLRAVAAGSSRLPVPAQPRRGPQQGSAAALSRPAYARQWKERRAAAAAILERVADRIAASQAKYGHLWWALEALHGLVNFDDDGTLVADEPSRLFPPGASSGLHLTKRNDWLVAPGMLVMHMSSLADHEMLLLHEWFISMPEKFESADPKPDPSYLDARRHHWSSHVFFAFKELGAPYVYDPEIYDSAGVSSHLVKPPGRHLYRLDAQSVQGYLEDQPKFGIFNYLQIFGKVTR